MLNGVKLASFIANVRVFGAPPPWNKGDEWTIEKAPFATQPKDHDCGILTVAAVFYRAAVQDSPGPLETLDGELWRLVCKSMLANDPVLSPIRDCVPPLDERVSVPLIDAAAAEKGPFTTNVKATIQPLIQHVSNIKIASINEYHFKLMQLRFPSA